MMKHSHRPKLNSPLIAEWRLYLWLRFLETGDDSCFLIPEDKRMARKAKMKIHRMEVIRYLIFILEDAKKPDLLTRVKTLIRQLPETIQGSNNPPTQTDNAYKTIMKSFEKTQTTTNYCAVTKQNEMRVTSNAKRAPFTGVDLFHWFALEGGIRTYHGREVIAVKTPDRCQLYFKEGNDRKPIKGIDAKLIGAAILADMTEWHLKMNPHNEIFLVQGYQANGKPDMIAEYYSTDLKNNMNYQDKPLLTREELNIQALVAPLFQLIDDINTRDFVLSQNIPKDSCIQNINGLIACVRAYYQAYPSKVTLEHVQQYANAIRGVYGKIFDPTNYDKLPKIRRMDPKEPLSMVHALLDSTAHARYESIKNVHNPNSSYHRRISAPSIAIIKKCMAEYNKRTINQEVRITLLDEAGKPFIQKSQNPPCYIKLSRKDHRNPDFIEKDNKGKPPYLCVGLSKTQSLPGITVESDAFASVLNLDMEMSITPHLPHSPSHTHILGAASRTGNTNDDIDSMAQFIIHEMKRHIKAAGYGPANTLTLTKIAYAILLNHIIRMPNEPQALLALTTTNNNAIISNESIYPRYVRINIETDGKINITLTSILRPFILYKDDYSSLHESLAIQYVITTNIFDDKPVFQLTEQAELKPAPELKPEYFFKPRTFFSAKLG